VIGVNPVDSDKQLSEVQPAALASAMKIHVFNADTGREIEAAFEVIGSV
jgi:hypothetical protein